MTELSAKPAVVLVGPMAVGKSTVGPILARKLRRDFIDVDEQIVEETGREISDIFATDGEQAFREIELAVTLRMLKSGGVIALGGGAVVTPQLRAALGNHRVFWLTATVTDAVRRVGDKTDRPLLVGDVAGNWARIAAQREALYAEVAEYKIVTSKRNPSQVAREIVELVESHEHR